MDGTLRKKQANGATAPKGKLRGKLREGDRRASSHPHAAVVLAHPVFSEKSDTE
jgi:hypothetical protein